MIGQTSPQGEPGNHPLTAEKFTSHKERTKSVFDFWPQKETGVHNPRRKSEMFSPIEEEIQEATLQEEDDESVFEISMRIRDGDLKPQLDNDSKSNLVVQDLYLDHKTRRHALKRLQESAPASQLHVTFLHEFVPELIDKLDPAIKPISVNQIFLVSRGADENGSWLEGIPEDGL
jgi:hypothetical protein